MTSFLRELLYLPINFLRTLVYAPGRLLSSGRKVLGLSLPARVAWVVALLLVICVVIEFVVYRYNPQRPFFRALTQHPGYLAGIAVLLVLIPLVVYHAVKLWLRGDVSPYEDIDKAWQAGVAELERQGLDPSQIPIFLVLGSAGEVQEQAIFAASRLSLNVSHLPQGPAALHWYANPDAIYILATNASSLSRLAALGRDSAAADRSRGPAVAAPSSQGIRGTIVAGAADSPQESFGPSQPLSPEPLPFPTGPAQIRGTMVTPSVSQTSVGPALAGVAAGERRPVSLPADEAADQQRRLEYLCHLIRRARQPLCPLNGILTLLPFGLIQRGAREGSEVKQLLKRDLGAVLRVCKVRCPVTAVIVGMEEEPGYQELVRRVGRERVATQRFGRGFSVANFPLPERLEALCAHACGAFEDWVYALFREKGALGKPGNTRLYALLCNIRHNVQTRLENILVSGYGSDPDRDPNEEPLLFSGCYFAATGETDDRQAFIKGVFDKLPAEQGELLWTRAALEEDGGYQRLAGWITWLDLLLLVGLAAVIVHHYWWK